MLFIYIKGHRINLSNVTSFYKHVKNSAHCIRFNYNCEFCNDVQFASEQERDKALDMLDFWLDTANRHIE